MFNIAEELAKQLGGVSESDHEQIEYIEIDRLSADKDNFYELREIPALASNIQLCGLQQPIRVRKAEAGNYTIVSGHRRKAALEMLIAEGHEHYASVPCIVETGGVSDAMRELRLIFANSSTRQLTPAEISRQAERVEMLLYQLKEEGVEFPGRMRDQVAAACKVSSTKLAELKVIREKLQEPFQTQFQDGRMNSSAAYSLARIPQDIQKDIALAVGGKYVIPGEAAKNLLNRAEKYYTFVADTTCKETALCCDNLLGFLKRTAKSQYSWQYCSGGCCLKCHDAANCAGACKAAKAAAKKDTEDRKRTKEREEAKRKKEQEKFKQANQKVAQRLLRAVDASGLSDEDKVAARYSYQKMKVSELRKFAAGDFGDTYMYSGDIITPCDSSGIISLANDLHCSTDFLLGLTEELTPPALPEGQLTIAGWMPGGTNPGAESGLCLCLMDIGTDEPSPMLLNWDGTLGCFKFKHGATVDQAPLGWMRVKVMGFQLSSFKS